MWAVARVFSHENKPRARECVQLTFQVFLWPKTCLPAAAKTADGCLSGFLTMSNFLSQTTGVLAGQKTGAFSCLIC